MKINKLIEKYKKKYNREWMRFVLRIIQDSECSIDLIDLLKNESLTEEIYNKLCFSEENGDIYISYENFNNVKTHLNDNINLIDGYSLSESMNLEAIHNPNFGGKFLIKYLDTLDFIDFKKIFNGSIPKYFTWHKSLISCVHFTPDLIIRYFVKYTNKSEDELINNFSKYINSNYYFWENYSKTLVSLTEKYIRWPWEWEEILKHTKINPELIEKHKDYIYKCLHENHIIADIKKSRLYNLINENFILNIVVNSNIKWDYKERLLETIDYTFNYRFNEPLSYKNNIGIPDEIIRQFIYEPRKIEEKYINLIMLLFPNNNLIKYRHLPEDVVHYLYKNFDNCDKVIYSKNISIINFKRDFIHSLFCCKYIHISIDTINYFNNKIRDGEIEHYLGMKQLDLQLNESFGWYQNNKYNGITDTSYLNKKKEIFMYIELDKYGDYYYRHLTKDNNACINEYITDKLNQEINARKIQRWWKLIIYNPHKKIGYNFAIKNMEKFFT